MSPMEAPTITQIILQFIPLLILTIPFTAMIVYIAIRKGRHPVLWLAIGIIPLFNLICVMWLLAQVNTDLKIQIKLLEDEVEKLKSK